MMEQNQSEVESLYYSTLQSISANLTSVQANIDNIEAQLDALNTGANDYYIYAPTSGVIHMDTPYKVGMVLSAVPLWPPWPARTATLRSWRLSPSTIGR